MENTRDGHLRLGFLWVTGIRKVLLKDKDVKGEYVQERNFLLEVVINIYIYTVGVKIHYVVSLPRPPSLTPIHDYFTTIHSSRVRHYRANYVFINR